MGLAPDTGLAGTNVVRQSSYQEWYSRR